MLDSNSLYFKDENGVERRMTILFTFDSPDKKKQYVIFQDPDGDGEEVYARGYTDDGDLFAIEDDDEWAMVEEVFNTFMDTEEETDD